jgi:hypothetical protein
MRRCLKGLRLSRKTNQAEKRRHMKARHANDGKKGETWAQHETGRDGTLQFLSAADCWRTGWESNPTMTADRRSILGTASCRMSITLFDLGGAQK